MTYEETKPQVISIVQRYGGFFSPTGNGRTRDGRRTMRFEFVSCPSLGVTCTSLLEPLLDQLKEEIHEAVEIKRHRYIGTKRQSPALRKWMAISVLIAENKLNMKLIPEKIKKEMTDEEAAILPYRRGWGDTPQMRNHFERYKKQIMTRHADLTLCRYLDNTITDATLPFVIVITLPKEVSYSERNEERRNKRANTW